MSEELKHYGMPRRSGRYPWGSGDDAYQRSIGWQGHIDNLRKQGLTEKQIYTHEGISSTKYRARITLAKNEQWNTQRNIALALKDKGYSTSEVGRRMGINESSVRNFLDPVMAERKAIINNTAKTLKEEVDAKKYIDVGSGIENHLGVSRTKLNNAVAQLEEQGYKVHTLNVPQVGMPGQFTIFKALGSPDSSWKELRDNPSLLGHITSTSKDNGRTFTSELGLRPIQHVNLDRVKVRYAEEGGSSRDGVIELRKGVSDLNLGNSKYAQVRIGVNGTHFLKGMAVYSDNLPDGVDIVFNTNKHDTGNKLDAMKKLKKDPSTGEIDKDNPFGATIKREFNEFGDLVTAQRGALNVVNEEGDWEKWSKTISSQVLSKQTVPLAKTQLGLALAQKKEEYDETISLTNPVVKKKLLLELADECDSAAVHLKAAGLPRLAHKIILPVPNIKENEVYAPTFNNGETVVLIRHPHGGKFEIPQLTVNNNSKPAISMMENAKDAIGIHPKVAQKLSGADFDGDTVIVIPNNRGLIKTETKIPASIKSLETFDTIEKYGPYDGMKTIDGGIYNAKTRDVDFGINPKTGKPNKPRTQTKQTKMGEASNLITDMTIKGANLDEIARAVKHSMVVIDSEKHHLDYKRSYEENGIAALRERYQSGKMGGASTLISRASSEIRVDERKPRSAQAIADYIVNQKKLANPNMSKDELIKVKKQALEEARIGDTGPIDPHTGMKVYTKTGESYIDKNGKLIVKKTLTTKMAEVTDAHKLSSGLPMEEVYADYANNLKAMANSARKEALSVIPITRNASAAKVYSKEVDDLERKLHIAGMNKPLERNAQIYANSIIDRKKQANPDLDKDDLKKIRNQALAEARVRMGAKKVPVEITDREWEAIQAGAISPSKLTQILQNTDSDRVKALATPRTKLTMTPAKIDKARMMLAAGHTRSDIANALGVSTSTLSSSLTSRKG